MKLKDQLYEERVRGKVAKIRCTRCKGSFEVDGRVEAPDKKLPSVRPEANETKPAARRSEAPKTTSSMPDQALARPIAVDSLAPHAGVVSAVLSEAPAAPTSRPPSRPSITDDELKSLFSIETSWDDEAKPPPAAAGPATPTAPVPAPAASPSVALVSEARSAPRHDEPSSPKPLQRTHTPMGGPRQLEPKPTAPRGVAAASSPTRARAPSRPDSVAAAPLKLKSSAALPKAPPSALSRPPSSVVPKAPSSVLPRVVTPPLLTHTRSVASPPKPRSSGTPARPSEAPDSVTTPRLEPPQLGLFGVQSAVRPASLEPAPENAPVPLLDAPAAKPPRSETLVPPADPKGIEEGRTTAPLLALSAPPLPAETAKVAAPPPLSEATPLASAKSAELAPGTSKAAQSGSKGSPRATDYSALIGRTGSKKRASRVVAPGLVALVLGSAGLLLARPKSAPYVGMQTGTFASVRESFVAQEDAIEERRRVAALDARPPEVLPRNDDDTHRESTRGKRRASKQALRELSKTMPNSVSTAPAAKSGAKSRKARTSRAAKLRARPAPAKEAFDIARASSAIDRTAARARFCGGKTAAHARATVTMTFDPSGGVKVLRIGAPLTRTVVGACVASVMRATRVPSFKGNPVTVVRGVAFNHAGKK